MNKSNVMQIISLSGAVVACAIGSGFATGQEVLQFFAGHGTISILGAAVAAIIFACCTCLFMKHGCEYNLDNPEKVTNYYFGKTIGKYVGYIFQIFLFSVYVIMISGAGATLSEYFGIKPIWGRILMSVLSFVTVILGLSKITDVLGKLGTVIIIFALVVGGVSFITNAGNIANADAFIKDANIVTSGSNWLWASVLYPGFNAITILFLTCCMGSGTGSQKNSILGGALGGFLFGFAVLIMDLGLLANIAEISDKSVPSLALASDIHPVFSFIFSIIICCGIYTTAVPLLWSVVRNFAEDGSKKSIITTVILTVAGLLLGMTDFKKLVSIVYPLSGYAGILLIILAIYKEIRSDVKKGWRKNGQNEYKRTA